MFALFYVHCAFLNEKSCFFMSTIHICLFSLLLTEVDLSATCEEAFIAMVMGQVDNYNGFNFVEIGELCLYLASILVKFEH